MSRKKLGFGLAAVIFLLLAYWLIGPLFFDSRVSESLDEVRTGDNEMHVLSQGVFTGADDAHKGSGSVKFIKIGDRYVLRFEDDFQVTNGPDLYVYLGRNGAYEKTALVSRLKGNLGGQNYEIPAGIDVNAYDEVWIWCRAFSTPFASAVLVEQSTVEIEGVEWIFTEERTDEVSGAPVQTVRFRFTSFEREGRKIEVSTYLAGSAVGVCSEVDVPESDAPALGFAQCWWAGAGRQFGIFREGDVVTVKQRTIAEEDATIVPMETVLVIDAARLGITE